MSVAPALVDDLRKELEPVALEPSALELLVALETGGAADAVSLTIPGWNWDQYVAVGRFLGEIKRRTSWYIGDLLISARDNFAEEFAQLEASTGLAPQTLLAYMFVCENVPPKRRKQGVPFSCHAAVARLTPAEQTKWLKLCESAGLTYAGGSGAGWTFSVAGNVVTATHDGPLAVGDSLVPPAEANFELLDIPAFLRRQAD